MKNQKITVVLMLLVLALLVGCSFTAPADKPESADKTLQIRRIDKESGFTLADSARKDAAENVVIVNSDDKVTVIVEVGDGISAEYLRGSYASLAELYNSEKGAALVAEMNSARENAMQAVAALGADVTDCATYQTIVNGFSAVVEFGRISEIEALSCVRNVAVAEEYASPEFTVSSVNDLFGGDGLFDNNTGYNGEGTLVAIIDTGIDYDHDAFQKEPEVQILSAEALGKVYKNTNAYAICGGSAEDYYISGKIPFAFDYADRDTDAKPSDLSGQTVDAAPHGTHVAGIVAGNDDVIKGAASEAQLAIMKTFYDAGGTNFSVILLALEDCLNLGVDMANLSLGSACGFSVARDDDADFMNRVMDLAEKTGLSLFCASGNYNTANHDTDYNSLVLNENPDNGIISAPASYRPTLSVGSINSQRKLVAKIDNDSENVELLYSVDANGSAYRFLDVLGDEYERVFEYVIIPNVGRESDYEGIDVNGKIAVVTRGEITFTEKQLIAAEKGAVACLILNNSAEGSRAQITDYRIPTAMVSLADAALIRNATVRNLVLNADSELYIRSQFSSMGAIPDCTIGVDILGVGGNVYSSVLHSYAAAKGLESDYQSMSGTSMASPNVTAVAASVLSYLRQNYPNLTGAETRDMIYALLMSTANVVDDENGNALSPRMQGAGVANLENAVNSSAYLEVTGSPQPKLSLGSDVEKDGVYTLRFNVVNFGTEDLSYELSADVYSESTSKGYILGKPYAFDDAEIVAYADGVLLESDEITVKAGSSVSLKVIVTLTEEDKAYMDRYFTNGIYVEGFVYLGSTSGDSDLSIPYMAFYGDWYGDMPIFDGVKDASEQLDVTGPFYGVDYDYGGGMTYTAYYNYCEFPYTVASGYEKPANSDKFLGIGEEFGIRVMFLTLLRNITDCGLYLEDSVTGETLLWGEFGAIQKSYSYYGEQPVNLKMDFSDEDLINANNFGFANNQRISMRIYGTFEEKTTQTVVWDFFVDYEKPTLLKAETSEKDGRTFLNLGAFDNGTIIAAKLYTEIDGKASDLLGGAVIPLSDSSAAGTDNSYSIDITDYLANIKDGKLIVELVDSARNASSFSMNLNGSDEEINVIDNADSTSVAADQISSISSEPRTYSFVSEYDASKAEFEVEDGVLVAYNGKGGDVVIPDNLGITEIGDEAFNLNGTITSVVIPEGVTDIGSSAFNQCYNMTKVVLSSTVEYLGSDAFFGCVKLGDINLEDARITYYARKSLGGNRAMKTITIPDVEGETVTLAGAFFMNMNLEEIVVNARLGNCSSEFTLCPELKKITFNKPVSKLLNSCFSYLDKLEEINFMDTVGEIGGYRAQRLPVPGPAQYRYTLHFTAVHLPALKTLNFYGDVSAITGFAFNSCENLENVTFYGNIPEKNLSAFGNCPKLSGGFKLGEGNDNYIRDEETGVIYNLDYTKMYTPNSWEVNGEFTLKDTITSLTARMFADSEKIVGIHQWEISIDDKGEARYAASITSADNKIGRTGFTKINLHEGITAIPDECFSNNRNLVLDLGNITSFGKYCLRNTGFTSIVLGENVESVDYAPWIECRNLTELSVSENTTVSAFYYWFAGTGFTTLEIPSYIDVSAANYICQYMPDVTRIVLPEGTTGLPYYFAQYSTKLETVGNTENITKILTAAFTGCSSLKSIDLPEVTSIATSFNDCTSLEYANYGDKLTSLSGNAFENCTSLKKIYYPAGLSVSVFSAFKGCTGVEEYVVDENNSVYASDEYGALYTKDMSALVKYPTASENEYYRLPDSVTALSTGIFMNAANLEKVEMPSITSIAHQAFKDSAVKEVVTGKVTEIGVEAFMNTNIASFDFGSVETLYSNAFKGSKITEVLLPDCLTAISSGVFSYCDDLRKITVCSGACEFLFSSVFEGCFDIEEIVIEEGYAYLAEENDMITNVDKTLLYYSFGNAEEIVVPEGIVLIGANAFANREDLKSVVLPATLKQIGVKAFVGCTALEKITFLGEKAPDLLGYASEGRTLTYENFVHHIEDGQLATDVYCKAVNASYDNYLFRTYFRSINTIGE